MLYEPPYWVHVVLWGAFSPLAARPAPVFKGVLIALQFKHKAEEGSIVQDYQGCRG